MKRVPDRTDKVGFTGRRGDPSKAKRCLAKTRRGTPCMRAAEKNPITGRRSRCRLHGGLSSGPRTEEGRRRSREAVLRHGRYTAAAQRSRAEMRQRLAGLRKSREELQSDPL